MKAIITGGAGFVGLNLCKKLLEEGNFVLVIDNFITSDEKNIEFLKEYNNFSFIKADICNLIEYDFSSFDTIFHLASPASPVYFTKFPIQTLLTNAIGTKNMLEIAKKYKMKFLITSTSEVYGDPLKHPQKESYFGNVNCVGERSCYNEGKRFAESLCMNFFKEFNTDVKIARLFNVYGPMMNPNDGRVVPEFITRAITEKALLVYGNGEQTRSFCFIDDIIDGLIKFANSPKSFVGPVNFGNPEEISIKNLAEIIIKKTGSKSEISYLEKLKDDPFKRCPDITKAKNELGFDPKTSLENGLNKTINYFESLFI